MYAVINACGKQYKVKKGDTVRLELLKEPIGTTKEFTEVLLVGEGADVEVGRPFVANARVEAEIVGVEKGPKLEIVHRKRRKQFKRHVGHRQPYTRVLITSLSFGSTKDGLSKEDREAILKRVGFVRLNELEAAREDTDTQAKKVEKQKARVAKAKAKVEAKKSVKVKKKAKAGKKASGKKSGKAKPKKKASKKEAKSE